MREGILAMITELLNSADERKMRIVYSFLSGLCA